jgi:phosphatidylglycerol:prolipoprotein diacylglycerol transferase
MFNFLHHFHPQAVLISVGPINIYWYGIFIVFGILAAMTVTFYLARKYQLKNERIFDLIFWLIIIGLIGARIYDVLLQLPYYLDYPNQIWKVWEGGLSIHGGIIAGLIFITFFAKRHKLSFWQLTAVLAPGLAFGQAIGRWGNYFNQELFGQPTTGRWGIPIDIINRPAEYINSAYFHPTFLYESLGCLAIGIFLLILNKQATNREKINKQFFIWTTALYMILYSILRLALEFIKINPTPIWLGLRWPQIISLITIIIFVPILFLKKHADQK